MGVVSTPKPCMANSMTQFAPSFSIAKLTRAQRAAIDLVAAVPHMSITEVRTLWPEYFAVPPFSNNVTMLARCLVVKIQEETFGRLSRSIRNRLEKIATAWNEGRAPAIVPVTKPRLRAGTRLLRSWHGALHEVTVQKNDFLYRGKSYRSLSEIARVITGVQWSGPLFFGLKNTRSRLISTRAHHQNRKTSNATGKNAVAGEVSA